MKGMVELGYGHYDYYKKGGVGVVVVEYVSAIGGDYTYNDDGTFTNTPGVGDYDAVTEGIIIQESSTEMDSSIETVNYSFQENLKSAPLLTFIKSAISLGLIDIQYSSDTNYLENAATLTIKNGEQSETCSFSNTDVRYSGSKQVKDQAINFGAGGPKNSDSFKLILTVNQDANRIDDLIIHSIKLVGDNNFYEGGDHGQSRT